MLLLKIFKKYCQPQNFGMVMYKRPVKHFIGLYGLFVLNHLKAMNTSQLNKAVTAFLSAESCIVHTVFGYL